MNNKSLIFILLVLSYFLDGCKTNDDLSLLVSDPNAVPSNDLIAIEDENEFKSGITYKVTEADAENFAKFIRPNQTCKIDPYIVNKDTVLFFLNFDKGWLILAGDKRTRPIVAESKKGNIHHNSIPYGVGVWLDSYAEEIGALMKVGDCVENEHTGLWTKVSPPDNRKPDDPGESGGNKWVAIEHVYCDASYTTIHIPHLIQTKWGQENPWNYKCPIDTRYGERCPTGCVAVAISQLMYYMRTSRSKMISLYENISVSNTSINSPTSDIGFSRSGYTCFSSHWENMALNAYDSGNKYYVGDLMMDVGNRVGMIYDGKGSSANISPLAMVYLDLCYSSSSYDYMTVQNNLQNGIPVNVSAYRIDPDSGNRKGHSWLIDGIASVSYHYVIETVFEYSENWMHKNYYDSLEQLKARYGINTGDEVIIEDGGIQTYNYLLMNWGYDGYYDDGFYSTYPSVGWVVDDRNYIYNKTINYDFR